MSFCTVINCMDGRVQLPVFTHLQKRFGVRYVDTVTDAGPVRLLASSPETNAARSMFRRVDTSVESHGSSQLAVVAHADCAGNPVEKARQLEQLRTAVAAVAQRYPACEVIGLWVDEGGVVSEEASVG
jgi:carbonic anhydrase